MAKSCIVSSRIWAIHLSLPSISADKDTQKPDWSGENDVSVSDEIHGSALVLEYIDQLSNWGRWGEDDVRGTLNLITPECLVAAGQLIRSGITVSCSRRIKPASDRRPGHEYLHFMLKSGETASESGFSAATDWFGMGVHGYDYTHLDAHAHVFWNGQMYNGRASNLCTTAQGARAGGVEPTFDGICGRGVLFDAPKHFGVDVLEPGFGIDHVQLDTWFDSLGLRMVPGDILFLRTGRTDTKPDSNSEARLGHFPGLRASCLPWLHEHDISVVVSDVITDVVPSGYEIMLPIHVVGLVGMGMWLVDNAELSSLARLCQSLGRYAFHTSIAPLPLRNATGCPVNPIVTF